MHHKACSYLERDKSDFDALKEEFDSIKADMQRIADMEISDEAKKLPLEELQKQINDVRERMHNYVDTL